MNFNFFSFILGGQFLSAQMINNGKGDSSTFEKLNETGAFDTWGVPTGPFASH